MIKKKPYVFVRHLIGSKEINLFICKDYVSIDSNMLVWEGISNKKTMDLILMKYTKAERKYICNLLQVTADYVLTNKGGKEK